MLAILSTVVGLRGVFRNWRFRGGQRWGMLLTRPGRVNWEIAKEKKEAAQDSGAPCRMRDNGGHLFEREPERTGGA